MDIQGYIIFKIYIQFITLNVFLKIFIPKPEYVSKFK